MSFAETLKTLGVTAEDIVKTSHLLEPRSAEERSHAAARRRAVQAGKKLSEAGLKKPKIGRALTAKSVQEATAGHPQSRQQRGKLLRAVNALAKRAKKKELSAIDLFGEAKRRKGKVPTKKTGK